MILPVFQFPSVQKKHDFLVMHPKIIEGVEKCREIDIKNVFGIIKCHSLPPTNMLFPILPVCTNKLIFPLCRTCALHQQEKCQHSDDERSIFGTWTSIGVQKAIEHGYKIIEQPIYDEIIGVIKEKKESSSLKDYEFIDCNKGIPSILQLKNKLGEKTLLVLDDLMVVSASSIASLADVLMARP